MYRLRDLNAYALIICLAISGFSLYFGLSGSYSADLPEEHYSSLTRRVSSYQIEEFQTSDKYRNTYFELALYTDSYRRFYLRNPEKEELQKYIGNVKRGDVVTIYYESLDGNDLTDNVIKSLYKDNLPIIPYADVIGGQKVKSKGLLKTSVVFFVIALILFVIRKKIPSGAILSAFASVILFSVLIMKIRGFYVDGNGSLLEYLKTLGVLVFALITAYTATVLIKPDFELLSLFKLNSKQKRNVTNKVGVILIVMFEMYFIYSVLNGFFTGEIYYYFTNSHSGWVHYENNPSLFLWGMGQSLFGLIVFSVLNFWVIKAAIKNKIDRVDQGG